MVHSYYLLFHLLQLTQPPYDSTKSSMENELEEHKSELQKTP